MKTTVTVSVCFALFAGVFAGPLMAQTIYKCQSSAGTVYSQQPCARDAGKMEAITLPPDPAPHLDDLLRAARAERAADEQLRQRQLVQWEVACTDNMAAATSQGALRRIRSYRTRIADLERQTRLVSNNLAGATWAAGLRSQIAQLEASIANEKNIAAQTELNARTICAQRRAQASMP